MDLYSNYDFGQLDLNPRQQRTLSVPGPGWQFSLEPVGPTWPDHTQFDGQSFNSTSETLQKEGGEEIWTTELWEQWDSIDCGGDNPLESPRVAFHPESRLATGFDAQQLSPISMQTTSSPRMQTIPQHLSADSQYSSAGSDYFTPKAVTTNLLIPIEDDVNTRPPGNTRPAAVPRQHFLTSSTSETTHSPKAKRISKAKAHSDSSPLEVRNHNDTERQYRTRLKDQFSILVNCLPKELTSNHRADGDKPLSKIEILDLARSYIATLERDGEQLQKEKEMLKGQVQLIRGLAQLSS